MEKQSRPLIEFAVDICAHFYDAHSPKPNASCTVTDVYKYMEGFLESLFETNRMPFFKGREVYCVEDGSSFTFSEFKEEGDLIRLDVWHTDDRPGRGYEMNLVIAFDTNDQKITVHHGYMQDGEWDKDHCWEIPMESSLVIPSKSVADILSAISKNAIVFDSAFKTIIRSLNSKAPQGPIIAQVID